MEVLGLVALADGTCAHPILHPFFHVGEMKITAKAVEGALDALMAIIMGCLKDLLE
jgi:hypothetical protein